MDLSNLDLKSYSFIEADDKNIKYTGRVDFTDKKAPMIIYAGSMIFTRFKGTSLKIIMKNYNNSNNNYIGYIIDGKVHGKVKIPNSKKKLVISIMSGLSNEQHDLLLYKRQDACHYFNFYGLLLDKGCKLSEAQEKPKRRIECFGDSIGTGEFCESGPNMNNKDSNRLKEKYSNGCLAFPLIAGKLLRAEVNNNSLNGLALLDNTGLFGGEKNIGLEFTYDKLKCNPELGQCTKWDFSRFIPHVVIIEIGHNDSYPYNFIDCDENKMNVWKKIYKDIINNLREMYPKALFILITSITKHSKGFDKAMNEIIEELNDLRVVKYNFIRNGMIDEKYLTVPGQVEMAQELVEFINSFGDEIWQN